MYRFRKCRRSHHLVHILIFFPNVWEGDAPSHTHPLRTLILPSGTPPVVGLYTTFNDEFDAIFYRIHCTKLARTQKATKTGNHRPASETSYKWRLASGPMMTRHRQLCTFSTSNPKIIHSFVLFHAGGVVRTPRTHSSGSAHE